MLPTANVRVLREILGVVRIVCLLWRPWEIGKRPIRKGKKCTPQLQVLNTVECTDAPQCLSVFSTGDNTLDNIMPRFARLFVTGKDVDGTSLWVSDADGE